MKAILLDLDGTLIDSVPKIMESYKKTINYFGFRVSKQQLRELAQVHSRDVAYFLMDNKRNDFNLNKFVKYRRLIFKKMLKKEKHAWFKDSKEFIEKASKKYKIAIVTGSRWEFLNEVFDEELKKKISFIVTSDDVEYKKPDIEPIRKALKKLKVKRHEALFIGDSTQDGLMCKRARIGFIAKNTGISTKHKLKKFNPIFVASNFKQIEKFIGLA